MAAAFLLALLPFFISGCENAAVAGYYEKGALATAFPIATRIGEQVFARGGNAFDVAVAVGFALAVVHPEAGNIGGGGFLLNNEMDDFAIAPGVPNLYGLVGGQANKIEPAKRMLSSMSPTIVLKNDKPLLILGSRGGSEIITAVAQLLINFSRFNLSIEKALSQPRFHHQWLPDNILLEEKSFDINLKQGLLKLGHIIKEADMISEIHAVYIDDEGLMTAAADRRGPGSVGGQ